MNFDFELIVAIIGVLLGGGGLAAYIKARSDLLKTKSEIRNADKSADIVNLTNTISALQSSYRELQDRYQEAIKECYERNDIISNRIELLEKEYIQQEKEKLNLQDRVRKLETDLREANKKIAELRSDLDKKDEEICKLKAENIELRKSSGHRVGLK